MLDRLAARILATGIMHEIREQPILVRRKLHGIAVHADATGAGVEPDRSAIELALGVPGGAAQQRADARKHFLKMKGFGYVIVGAGVEALRLGAPAVARREYEDGHGPAGAAPRLQDGDTVHLGKSDIQNNGVVGLALAEKAPLLAVERPVDHVARIGQRGGELPIEIGIILNDEETQGNVPPWSAF